MAKEVIMMVSGLIITILGFTACPLIALEYFGIDPLWMMGPGVLLGLGLMLGAARKHENG